MIFLVFGCLTRRGIYYRVRHGDTVDKIARRFNISQEKLLTSNSKLKNKTINPGSVILIPAVQNENIQRGLWDILGESENFRANNSRIKRSDDAIDRTGKLLWPLKKYRISSYYGKRGVSVHKGLDLVAKMGSPIYAAESGIVIYSGNGVKGYGNLLVIKHSDNLSTIYAHNKKNLVKKGIFVKRGQKIALLGNTGKTTGAHLHFEVRYRKAAKNPIYFLEKRYLANK